MLGKIIGVGAALLQKPWARLSRGKTLGVRVAAINAAGELMLIRHTYSKGWHLPGGGVDHGETLLVAATREVLEEAGIVPQGNLELHGMFSNEAVFAGDHVACFVLREFGQQPWKPDFEIAEAKFFNVRQLPVETTEGTRRRISEIVDGAPISEHW